MPFLYIVSNFTIEKSGYSGLEMEQKQLDVVKTTEHRQTLHVAG